ncbi:hypothetical protein HY485_03145 [Candidatus Woesearchaeota archaeon]|nr:hypothetical protein [Candidatus Woesearchaeota archaeon]
MAEVEVIARKWGSSIGVVIPNYVVEEEHIEKNEHLKIEIKKRRTARDIWGLFPKLRIDAQKAKEEMRKGWD